MPASSFTVYDKILVNGGMFHGSESRGEGGGKRMVKTVGQVLETVCEEQGLWHYQVARRLNVSKSAFSRYITGQGFMPDDVVANAIRYFNCPELGRARCRECPIARAMGQVGRMEVAA